MQTLVASFLAGAILSWAMPITLLVIFAIYWTIVARRRSGDTTK